MVSQFTVFGKTSRVCVKKRGTVTVLGQQWLAMTHRLEEWEFLFWDTTGFILGVFWNHVYTINLVSSLQFMCFPQVSIVYSLSYLWARHDRFHKSNKCVRDVNTILKCWTIKILTWWFLSIYIDVLLKYFTDKLIASLLSVQPAFDN